MRHRRSDYEAIQPWPTQRPHIGRVDGENTHIDLSLYEDDEFEPIIPDDEPVFLIRAIDKVGPAAVRVWADLAEDAGARPDLIQAVREWANEMEAYALDHDSHVPDAPKGVL